MMVMQRYCSLVAAFALTALCAQVAGGWNDDVPSDCSQDPRWIGNREFCQNATGWTPQSTLWQKFVDPLEAMEDEYGADRKDELGHCLDEAMEAYHVLRSLKLLDEANNEDPEPVIFKTYRGPKTNKMEAMEIKNALPERYAYAVKSLAGCIRTYFVDNNFDHRPFDGAGGGNDCTFLITFIQLLLPGVASHIQRIAAFAHQQENGWKTDKLAHPRTLGLRTSEHLSYGGFRQGLGGHADTGSLYTVLFSLSDPHHYEGGTFYIRSDEEKGLGTNNMTRFKPDKYSAIVFLSENFHGVDPIPSGHREMFTNELWRLLDPAFPMCRPQTDEFDLYCHRVLGAIEDGEPVEEVVFPSADETDVWLKDNKRERAEPRHY